MLNLSFVRTFVTLVETGSFSNTARRLELAQPTVSQHLKKLEALLGVMLIERSNTSCTPTAKGLALLPYAHSLLSSAARFESAVNGDHICIGCSGNIAAYYISNDLKQFVDRQNSAVSWEIRTATNPEIADKLTFGEIDLAAMEWPDQRKGIDVLPWRVEPLVVIVPPDHPLSRARSISVDEMLQLDIIGGERGSGTGTVLQKALGQKARDLRLSHTLHSTEAVKSAVSAGLGCSIVLRGAVKDDVAAGNLKMLPVKGTKLEKTFYIALPTGIAKDALPARLAAFLVN
jgi:LysR family transcriptional regulator, low CO2-responsive transcriptional regulator